MPAALIEQAFRGEHARVLAGLVRRFRDFDLAEDALQDAYAKALVAWERDGLPENPAAWLTTAASRSALDRLRRRRTTGAGSGVSASVAAGQDPEADPATMPGVEDDRLRLLFTCCHPAIAPGAQSALALRTLCGLSTREIARAFLEAEATTAQRLVRVKRKIVAAGIPYSIPSSTELPARVAGVLAVVYLVFNEGYAATEGDALARSDLCIEGIRLGRLIVELLPREAEARGLLALMLLHDARRGARVDGEGVLVPLEEQDRSCWNAAQIAEGLALLDTALCMRSPGPYQIQAAIAALHAQAPQARDTDWLQILALYGALLRHQPTPVVELNAAVALAMVEGPAAGLRWIDRLGEGGRLDDYHPMHAARADLLRREGRMPEARTAYERAIALARNPAERAFLARRLREIP